MNTSLQKFQRIDTDRIMISLLEPQDKEPFFAYRIKPEVYNFQLWKPASIDEVEKFINKNATILPDTQNTWMQLGIHLQNGVLIGDMGIHFLDDDQVEIGYTLSPDHQGYGYAFEAINALLDYLFLKLNKHRITASVDPDNQKSINLLKKLGFRPEAHFKKSILIHGEWCDDLVFALLGEEWKSAR